MLPQISALPRHRRCCAAFSLNLNFKMRSCADATTPHPHGRSEASVNFVKHVFPPQSGAGVGTLRCGVLLKVLFISVKFLSLFLRSVGSYSAFGLSGHPTQLSHSLESTRLHHNVDMRGFPGPFPAFPRCVFWPPAAPTSGMSRLEFRSRRGREGAARLIRPAPPPSSAQRQPIGADAIPLANRLCAYSFGANTIAQHYSTTSRAFPGTWQISQQIR